MPRERIYDDVRAAREREALTGAAGLPGATARALSASAAHRITLALTGALMFSSTARAGDALSLYRLDRALRVAQTVHWRADAAPVGPVHVSATGDVVALLPARDGAAELVRWDGQTGREVLRRPTGLAGVLTSRLDGEALVVVTDREIVKLDARDGRALARAGGFQVLGAAVSAAPDGAWFGLPDRLLRFGLDGSRAERPLPIDAPPGVRNRGMYLLATARGECLVAELRTMDHAVSGRDATPDRTSVAALALVSPTGDVLAQATRGRAHTWHEWFWAEGSTEGPFPRGFGLVRTRYAGSIALEALAERPEGFVLVANERTGPKPGDETERLVALDRHLRERWSAPAGGMEFLGSPPSGRGGILFRTRLDMVRVFDDANGAATVGELPSPEDDPSVSLVGTALGRAPDGSWIVVAYGPEVRSGTSPQERSRTASCVREPFWATCSKKVARLLTHNRTYASAVARLWWIRHPSTSPAGAWSPCGSPDRFVPVSAPRSARQVFGWTLSACPTCESHAA